MADVHDPVTRSRNMAAVRGRDTKPEMVLRQILHQAGFRYRLCRRDLPGRPDLVFPKYRAVIFVNGCFWHGHDCALFRWPASREDFWRDKISATRLRDQRNLSALTDAGWRVAQVWECALKGRQRLPREMILPLLAPWLRDGEGHLEISGSAQGRA